MGVEVLHNSWKFRVGMVFECCIRTRTRTRVFLKGHTRTPGIVPRAYSIYQSSVYG